MTSATPGTNEKALSNAGERALRQWLFELGYRRPAIETPAGDLRGVYYLANVHRVVQVTVVVAPSYPELGTTPHARHLCDLAERFIAQPWEAGVIVGSTYHPQALVWRRLSCV
jgi:hypothetical protein